ncbi:MAG: isochorismatase family protein [Chloroflexota bacterium]
MKKPNAPDEPRLGLLQAEPGPLELDLARTAVMVIDMQNGYASPGGLFDRRRFDLSQVPAVTAAIQKLTGAARASGNKVIYVVTTHPADLADSGGEDSAAWHKDAALTLEREHPEWRDTFTIRGTWGAEVIDALKPQAGDIVFEKMRYSAFFQTNLDTVLKTYRIKYLLFAGVATNICVEATIRDAYYLGYFPILVTEATGSLGAEFLKQATMHNVKTCYGWLTSTGNAIRALKI